MGFFLLTIDVEDWFQVENFKKYIPFSSWPDYELRVEKNTHRLLDLFDSIEVGERPEVRSQKSEIRKSEDGKQERAEDSTQSQESNDIHPESSIQYPVSNKITATFFILAWIAERLPNLVREINARGHEVASHGYYHNLYTDCSVEELKNDLTDSKKLLEDLIGDNVSGYRAPSFSINDDILKIVEDSGYLYDSSYNSFGLHRRYGKLKLNGNHTKGIVHELSGTFYELPISNLELKTRNSKLKTQNLIIPWGGGGYFRLIPFFLFRRGVASILRKKNAYMLYLHPWEIDADQPRLKEASTLFKFRHYVSLIKCETRLAKMINTFRNNNFIKCRQYIDEVNGIV